ncbi:MAG: 4-alpha-glucanotransferase [bacterium]|nr:4-alpha-glucanotransferase [bacterium]
MTSERPVLRKLAERLGVLDGYRTVDARAHATSDATRQALVAAMGYRASSEEEASNCLERLDRRASKLMLEPVLVWREWAQASPTLQVNPQALGDARDYRIVLRLEDGRKEVSTGRLERQNGAPLELPLPVRPPHGYHDVELTVAGASGQQTATQRVIMTPRTVVQPEEVLGHRRAFGVLANLYSVRSRGGFGHGSVRELEQLGRMAGELGASFVGINPLHALSNRGLDFSPYSPTSRIYRNILYLDPEAVPELAFSAPARSHLNDPRLRQRRALLEGADEIDHAAVLDWMLPLLRELHTTFRAVANPMRKDAFAAYLEREGEPLRNFAVWECLAAHHRRGNGDSGASWWRWPEKYRDPRNPAVEAFRVEHADEVDFCAWLQFELDRQLGDATANIREAGCSMGIYQDLALGSSSASADTWMEPDLFASGAHVGAPPDAYAAQGQNWGFPPFDPHKLRADAYRPWTRLLRAAFAHTGALRIDHVMGVMRLFWIPEGQPGSEGAYVSYRADDLLGILALESRRHHALVVAEDLGTLPSELPGLLADWGLLRSAVVIFEREADHFRPTSHYPPRALASLATHDAAPLAGYFDAVDLELRGRAGGEAMAESLARECEDRVVARHQLVHALRDEGFLDADNAEPDFETLRAALFAFLAATPSVLVGVSLDDLAEERQPVNLPGIALEAHRSWSRRMALPLEELGRSPAWKTCVEPLRLRFREAEEGR